MSGRKCLVGGRGQKRMVRVLQASNSTTYDTQGVHKNISECTSRRPMKLMGYSRRRSLCVLLLQLRTAKEMAHVKEKVKNVCGLKVSAPSFECQNLMQKTWKDGSILTYNNNSDCWWWCNDLGDFFGDFIPTELRLSPTATEYCCWPCPSLFDHCITHPCHKTPIISSWFLQQNHNVLTILCRQLLFGTGHWKWHAWHSSAIVSSTLNDLLFR